MSFLFWYYKYLRSAEPPSALVAPNKLAPNFKIFVVRHGPGPPRANSQFAVDGCAGARSSPMYPGASSSKPS